MANCTYFIHDIVLQIAVVMTRSGPGKWAVHLRDFIAVDLIVGTCKETLGCQNKNYIPTREGFILFL